MTSKKCNYCDKTEGLEYHHIIPRSMGGTDEECNLLLVCNDHHAILHGMKARANISALTKEGLRKAKERGVKIGGWGPKSHENSKKTIKANADKFAEDLKPLILSLRLEGLSINRIADELNSRNIKTATDKTWYATTVANLMRRWQEAEPSSARTVPAVQHTPSCNP